MALTTEARTTGAASPAPTRRRPWWRRRIVKRSTIWLHRWTSIALGLLLLAVTTSGAVLLYEPDLRRWDHREAYAAHRPVGEVAAQGGLTLPEFVDRVRSRDPAFVVNVVYDAHGTYVAESYDAERKITMDPATGRVLGDFSTGDHDEGPLGWTLSLMYNIHLCALTCVGYPAYQAWLLEEIPGSGWAGFEDANVTWGGALLGVLGLLLLLLALSGIWLWWPGVRRFAQGWRVRWRKGRFARDTDLHQVAGMIVLPFLLMWGLTGAGYEFGFVAKGWYAALPGEDNHSHFESAPPAAGTKPAPDITPQQAVERAATLYRTSRPPSSLDLPSPSEATATYIVWYADGFDPYGEMDYSGDLGVGVDRRTGATEYAYGPPGRTAAEQLWQDWNFPVHTGYVVNPWWRAIWLVFGLAPLLLAITGLSTWLYKRRTRKRRRQAEAAREAELAG